MRHFVAVFVAALLMVMSISAAAQDPFMIIPDDHWVYDDLAVLNGSEGDLDSAGLSRYDVALRLADLLEAHSGKILAAAQRQAMERLIKEFYPELESLGVSIGLEAALLEAAEATLNMQKRLQDNVSLEHLVRISRGPRVSDPQQGGLWPGWDLKVPKEVAGKVVLGGSTRKDEDNLSGLDIRLNLPSSGDIFPPGGKRGVTLDDLRAGEESPPTDRIRARMPLGDSGSISAGYQIGKDGEKSEAELSIGYNAGIASISANYRLINFGGLLNEDNSIGAEVSIKF